MTHKEIVVTPAAPEGEIRGPAGPSDRITISERLWRLWFAFGGLLAAASILGFAGGAWWVFDVMAHFRPQYFLGLGVIAPTALWQGRGKMALAFGVLAVVNLALLWPYLAGSPGVGPKAGAKSWRAMALNVHTRNDQFERVRALVRERRPDLLVLTEVDERWLAEMTVLSDEFPFREAVPQSDNFGIAFFSRVPPRSLRVRGFVSSGIPSIIGEFDWGSGTLTVLGTHPLPPRKPDYAACRDAQFARMGDFLAGIPGPKLVLGDLNSTPWSAVFQSFQRRAGLRDSGIGWGLRPTWPVGVPLFWSPIDHALVSADLAVIGRRVGGDVGSDHLPVEIDFAPAADSP